MVFQSPSHTNKNQYDYFLIVPVSKAWVYDSGSQLVFLLFELTFVLSQGQRAQIQLRLILGGSTTMPCLMWRLKSFRSKTSSKNICLHMKISNRFQVLPQWSFVLFWLYNEFKTGALNQVSASSIVVYSLSVDFMGNHNLYWSL